MLPDWLRVILGRVIGSAVAGLVTWLAGKGINIDQHSADAIISVGLTIFTVVYSLVHTFVNAHINPRDVSSPSKINTPR